jgi:hypothetical protein
MLFKGSRPLFLQGAKIRNWETIILDFDPIFKQLPDGNIASFIYCIDFLDQKFPLAWKWALYAKWCW